MRERYSEKPAPKCHICVSVMTIQRAGAGSVVYGCTGRIDKYGEGYNLLMAETSRNDHYARSRVMVANESDSDVLALLDERERNQQYIKRRDQENEEIALTVGKLRVELEAAEKRIAELQLREVVLPQCYSMLHRVDFDEPYHTEMVYRQHQVLEALNNAGINVTEAGKGEAS
ncbi:TPA: ead/Ea22-like family protein [Escherichia coli]|nr:ead/Ea22-like family protein [Escherichia coli]